MLWKLLALFVLVPLAELILLLLLAQRTSFLTTMLVVLGTGVAGTLLARSQGWKTLQIIHSELAQGRIPTDSLLDAALILCAGVLLLTPGLMTDALGLSLLVPTCRRKYRHWLRQWFGRHFRLPSDAFSSSHQRSEIVDSYVVDSHPDDPQEGRETRQ